MHGVIRDVTELRRLQAITTAQALRDPLTGISNRRRFDQLLHSELERTAQSGTALAVAYIDLDGLKQINDQHGHATGDIMLQESARRLERSVDRAEMLARLGGDEYAIIFEPTTISACQLRRRIGVLLAAPIVVSDTLTIECTASVGIAETTSAGRNADDLVAAADRAMYDDKHHRQLG
jgi:diguanylate cyclase (GGDEF)-like protein